MSESFAELFEQSLHQDEMQLGSLLEGVVVRVDKENVLVSAGLKSESYIPLSQFTDEHGNVTVSEGDKVEVVLEAIEDGFGATRLSREKAKRVKAWESLVEAYEAKAPVMGVVSGKVKGGFTVELDSIRAFLPGSLVDVRPVREPVEFEGKAMEFKVIKLDKKRNNVVVSRRSMMESENSAERETTLNSLQEGQEVTGIVKNLTDYGAFVDLGGIDGLLHITDMAWKRVKHPNEVVAVGQELMVKVLKFDRDRSRVSLGLKQLGQDPWRDIQARYEVGSKLHGRVTSITDYGCFVELEEGVEGLVHVSEMDWTNKNIHPSKVVQFGDEVDVMVLEIDEDRRRISLGLKQCQENPWEAFGAQHSVGEKIKGTIKSITDFGIFVGLQGEIDGLIHVSDLSWQESGEELIRNYKKGQELETVIVAIDPKRERISLGIKQMEEDSYSHYIKEYPKGSIVQGSVAEVDEKGALIHLAEGVDGYLKANEIARESVSDASTVLKAGETVEAKIVGWDRKNRSILLSIKAKDSQEEKVALKKLSEEAVETSTTLGDLLKDHIEDNNKDS